MSAAADLHRASASLGKPDALAFLARQAGLGGETPNGTREIAELIARLPPLANQHIATRSSAELGLTPRLVQPGQQRPVPLPVFTNGRPASFPEHSGVEHSPAFEALELPGGCVAQLSRAPAVLTGDGGSLVADFSSPYAGLLHGYDIDLAHILAGAHEVEGDAVVLCDDIHPLNYSHWILDELPRLALLGERRQVTIITAEEDRPFKRESLRLCGFSDRQVIHLGDFQAVRAGRLLVPRDIADMPHPAHKAAPWVLDFLRGRVGFAALAAQQEPPEMPAKLFISRDDSIGRRIMNEAALMEALAPLGYRRVTLAGRTLAQQVALFARATHVLGAHGAGLSNFAFAPRGARLLEIFPRSYGTPAFYVLAAGQGNPYATYVAAEVIPGDRTQTDDIRLDVGDFLRCCRHLL